MSTKIKSITVLGKTERIYSIGDTVNDRIIDRIDDKTIEYDDSIHFFYVAYDFMNEVILEFYEVPVIVEYIKKDQDEK